MKKSFLSLEGVEMLSKNEQKSISGGEWGVPPSSPEVGPEPPCGSWSYTIGNNPCSCAIQGGVWACDQCITNRAQIAVIDFYGCGGDNGRGGLVIVP